jgi:hypothetical protein
MAALTFNAELKLATQTLAAIEAGVLRSAEDGLRPHLGASLIGRSCERQLWYTFRWAKRASFEGRMLRLFARGQREEDALVNLLRNAGITVHAVDPATGSQFRFGSGHFSGSMDGACLGLPEAPKTWHVLEFKTHGKKSFDTLESQGVRKAKPEHWAQMQCYMAWTGMERALYVSVCKDDDRLHLERVDFDKEATDKLFERAERIINASEPPQRIGDASWYECKWCDYKDICHGTDAPLPTCRSCAHSTPEKAGYWSCARNGHNEIPINSQKQGCEGHRYIPAMLHWAEVAQASHEDNWVTYRLPNGGTFINGEAPGYSSAEIHACTDKVMLGDAQVQELKAQWGAKVVA